MAATQSARPSGCAVPIKAVSVDPARPQILEAKALPADGYSRWNSLRNIVPFSRETLRKYELDGRFPRRVRLTLRCSAWSNRELHRYFSDPENYRAEA